MFTSVMRGGNICVMQKLCVRGTLYEILQLKMKRRRIPRWTNYTLKTRSGDIELQNPRRNSDENLQTFSNDKYVICKKNNKTKQKNTAGWMLMQPEHQSVTVNLKISHCRGYKCICFANIIENTQFAFIVACLPFGTRTILCCECQQICRLEYL